jgi:hypothetical protein
MTTVELYREGDKDVRIVRAQVDEKGFTLETQDLGPAAKKAWGDSDYEFWTSVPEEAWGQLLLALAQEYFADATATDRLADICKRHGVRYKWFSY